MRRWRSVVGGAVLTLALGGLAAAQPAQASADPNSISPGKTSVSPGYRIYTYQTSVITDSLNPGGVTAPDAIVTCATSVIQRLAWYNNTTQIIGTDNPTIPVGCLTLYNGEWVKVAWDGVPGYLELTQQTDGNLVLTVNNGTTSTTAWSSNTTFQGNSQGPGCLAQFQSSADLVVDNCDGTSIWSSGAQAYPDAVLNFQYPNVLVIYEYSTGGLDLWSTS